jgi:hypothetical protein
MTHIVNDNICMLPGKFENNRLAYSTIAAGNDGDFVLQ